MTQPSNKKPSDKKQSRSSIHQKLKQASELDWPERIQSIFNISFGVIGRLFRYLIILILCGGALVAGTGLGYFASLVQEMVVLSESEMREAIAHLEKQSTLYYASGEPIASVQSDIVRTIVKLDDISPYAIDGLISTEDEYFYDHKGILPKAIIRAGFQEILSSGVTTGGSTLTQQLVKQQLLSLDVTFSRKAKEILLALRLENFLTKDEILTAYLNVSPFGRNNEGNNVAGIEAAAQGVFGVAAKDLNLNQAAFLVGLPQNPYVYTPYEQTGQLKSREEMTDGIERMQEVLFRMYRNQTISKDDYETAKNYDIYQDFLKGNYQKQEYNNFLYQAMMQGAIEEIMKVRLEEEGSNWKKAYNDDELFNRHYAQAEEELRTGGYHVYTTIDKQIYDQMQRSARENNDQLGRAYEGSYTDPNTGFEEYYSESVQVGMVVIDNSSGKVLGFISGVDYNDNQIDHAFSTRRSPGSTIKPLAVYGPALETNLITPSTIIPDTAFVEEYEDGSQWAPTNYGQFISNEFMSARKALYKSDNIPAVRIYKHLLQNGVPIIDYLDRMGFNTAYSYTEEDTQNLAFSLGGVTNGPTVFEETRAFTTLANEGNYKSAYYIERIEDADGQLIYQHQENEVRVFSEDTNYLLVDMLRDTMTEGTGRIAAGLMTMGGDWIAKTGISENSKDVWTIALTPKITIGSWIGYDSRYGDFNIDLNDGYGRESERSQRHWAAIVNDLYEIRPEIFGENQQFVQPSSVVKTPVLQQTGTLPGTFQVGYETYSLMAPLYEDLFKVNRPAPELSYDFLFDGDDELYAQFWSAYRYQQQQQQQQMRQRENQQSQNESSAPADPNNPTPEQPPADANPANPQTVPATPQPPANSY